MNRKLLRWPSFFLLGGLLLAACSDSDTGEVDNGEDVRKIVVDAEAPNATSDTDQSGQVPAADQNDQSDPRNGSRGEDSDDPTRTADDADRDGARAPSPTAGDRTGESPGPTPAAATVGVVSGVSGSPLPAIGEVDYSMVSLPAPDFSWKNVDGSRGSLKDYRGSVVLLNIWGTWCGPCRRELPDIVAVREEFRRKGLEVIGVAVNERPVDGRSIPQNLAAFAKANGLEYPLVVDDARISEYFGQPPSVPTTFVIDRKGRVTGVLVGARSAEDFRKAVTPHL